MKVLIFCHGTRGDVQPYVALAWALTQAGHDAVLAAPSASAELAAPYGLRFIPLDDGPNRLMDPSRAGIALARSHWFSGTPYRVGEDRVRIVWRYDRYQPPPKDD